MSVPGLIEERLGGEEVEARLSLGGEDEVYVTPTRTLVYWGEGLLRDESLDEYSHDAERLTFQQGRRKTTITFEYALEGEQTLTIPNDAVEKALQPILKGVLAANDVIEDGEDVLAAYRFSELTLVVAENRLVKHIGSAVFDEEYEEFPYEDITGLDFEEGSVAMQVVIVVDGRSERIKAPNEAASAIQAHLENALLEFHDVDSREELQSKFATDQDVETEDEEPISFGEGLDPLQAEPPTSEPSDTTETDDDSEPVRESATEATETEVPFEEAGFEPANSESMDLESELTALREAVERQNQLLAKQQQTIEQLIEELSRGR